MNNRNSIERRIGIKDMQYVIKGDLIDSKNDRDISLLETSYKVM